MLKVWHKAHWLNNTTYTKKHELWQNWNKKHNLLFSNTTHFISQLLILTFWFQVWEWAPDKFSSLHCWNQFTKLRHFQNVFIYLFFYWWTCSGLRALQQWRTPSLLLHLYQEYRGYILTSLIVMGKYYSFNQISGSSVIGSVSLYFLISSFAWLCSYRGECCLLGGEHAS